MICDPSDKEDSKSKMLLKYYQILEETIESTLEQFKENITLISDKADEISAVIKTQNEYATAGYMQEPVNIVLIMEEVLALHRQKIEDQKIMVTNSFEAVPDINSQRPKLVFIFSSIIGNALDSLESNSLFQKKLKLGISLVDDSVQVKIADTGVGISKENLKKVFQHGYTTNSNKTGFGLHTCGNYVLELGGQIHCESKGENQGATFILRFPLIETSPAKT